MLILSGQDLQAMYIFNDLVGRMEKESRGTKITDKRHRA